MKKSLESNQTPTDKDETRKKSVEDKDDLIFELIKRRYDGVLQNINALDTKAASLIGFVAVVVGLIVGGSTFDFSKIAKSFALYIPYFASVVLLLGSIYFGLKALKEKRNFLIAPDVNILLGRYAKSDVSYSRVLQTTGRAMVDAGPNLLHLN